MSSFVLHSFRDYAHMSQASAQFVYDQMIEKLAQGETFVFGLATGQSPKLFYQELLILLRSKPVDLSNLYTVNLDEYYPIVKTSPHSYYAEMLQQLWEPLYAINHTFQPAKQAFIASGEAVDPVYEAQQYEERIAALGGVDLQLLGLGVNGHIGFNEPGSPADSHTRLVMLAEETIAVNAQKFFGGNHALVPKKALTMGIGTILQAKQLVMLVSGAPKSQILAHTLRTKIPHIENPASFLMTHPHVHFFADEDALMDFRR